jgi:hypothetical protein
VNAAVLAEGNHLLDERTRGLGLGKGGLNAIIDDDGGYKVAQKSATVTGVAAEFEAAITMTHCDVSFGPA